MLVGQDVTRVSSNFHEISVYDFYGFLASEAKTINKPIRGVNAIEAKKYPQNPNFLLVPNKATIRHDVR